jgi:hypothetical protein
MKKFGVIIALVIIAIAGFLTLRPAKQEMDGTAVYTNSALGYEFTYRTGPNGYVVEEASKADPDNELLSHIMLVRTKDLPMIQNPPAGSEGPATINIAVYKNTKKQQPLNWADEHTQASNISLKTGDVSEAVSGGANAIRYKADGLYVMDILIVAHGGNIYVIDGQYADENSDLKKDFSPIVESLKFIPSPNSSGNAKLNIDTVCESALSYMTFSNSQAADAFVKDCKNGNRPEVIEKYKKDNGLDQAAI